jgi:small conductance mechanosensitive channel
MRRPCLVLFVLSAWAWVGLGQCAAQTPLGPAMPEKQATPPQEGVAEAEAMHLAHLQGALEADQKARDQVKAALERVDAELRQAGMEVTDAEKQLQEGRPRLRQLEDLGKAEEAEMLRPALASLEARGLLAKEQFDTLIQRRSALQERLQALEQKIISSRQEIQRLEKVGTKGRSGPESSPSGDGAARGPSERIEKARQSVQTKKTEASDAEDTARSLSQRLESLKRFIALEEKLLATARKKAELVQADHDRLRQEADQLGARAASAGVTEKLTAVAGSLRTLRQEIQERTQRLSRLQTELAVLQEEQAQAAREAEARKAEAARASQRLARLENPFTLHNALRWLSQHGLRLALIIAGTIGAFFLIRATEHRIVNLMVEHADPTRREERENRVRTLLGVFHNAAVVTLFGGGALMALDECGIPIVPLMGGAAVLGLAIAFGAQSLIKDYFSGFIMLMETQYGVNDVVRIGALSGTVERITLRMTALRDLEGVVHFIPHGQVTSVSNLTHGWSRALFEVSVPYSEDPDRAVEALVQLGKEMRADAQFAGLILDDLEMLGVDQLAASAVVIKCFFKTRPLKQWLVKREMLRRIKKRFDELGISSPQGGAPHHHEEPAAPRLASDGPTSAARGAA